MGRDFEPQTFEFSGGALNDHEVYVCRLDRSDADKVEVNFAVSISPYLIVEPCQECKVEQVFFFDSRRGKRFEYLSYQCGHKFIPSGYVADFEDIQAFLAGASAAAVGVIVVVSIDLIPEALAGLPSIAIAVVAFLLIVLFKIDVAKVAVTAMAGGVLHAVVRGFVY